MRVGRRILGEAGISESSLLEKLEAAQAEYFKAREDNANKDVISQRYCDINEGRWSKFTTRESYSESNPWHEEFT